MEILRNYYAANLNPMKKITITLLGLLLMHSAWAQLDVFVNPITKDSVISTPFDTLTLVENKAGKTVVQDKVVGIKNVHKKKQEYWLFFYFMPVNLDKESITISSNKYAYLLKDNGTYLRIPYNGKTFTYKQNQMAGFFIDVSKYIDEIKSSNLTYIRLETSNLYHEIALLPNDKTAIANIISKLTNGK